MLKVNCVIIACLHVYQDKKILTVFDKMIYSSRCWENYNNDYTKKYV